MSYADHRPALRISSLPVTRVDFLSTGKIWLSCPSCGRWVTTAKRAIAAHRAADDTTRCPQSGRKLEVDVPAEEHHRRRALAVTEASQRRAVYSARRTHPEPRTPIPGPLARRPGGPTRPQTAGWSGRENAFTTPRPTSWSDGITLATDPGQTWNAARRIVRPARTP